MNINTPASDKLYKYRPLSEELFKEFYCQEVYFASYEELNDPMDLSARMDFTPIELGRIEFLTCLAFKTSIQLNESRMTHLQKKKTEAIFAYKQDVTLRSKVNRKGLAISNHLT